MIANYRLEFYCGEEEGPEDDPKVGSPGFFKVVDNVVHPLAS